MNAEKDYIQDMISYTIYAFLILFLLSMVILFKNIGDNDHFSKHTSNVLSRYGVCSPEALRAIDDYNNSSYNGRYKVYECVSTGKTFGSAINYKVEGDFSLLFIDTPFKLRFGGSTPVIKRAY